MEDNKINLKIDIFKSVKSDAISELTPELLETSLDLLSDSEILKDIPVFGIGFKSYSLYKKITETFFTKKLLKFLMELKDIPLLDREKYINDLESKNETQKAGEKLLVTLNRLNDDEKATFIGRLLRETILGRLDYKDFSRLTHIIDNAYIEDLKVLEDNPYLYHMSDEVKSNLHQTGLIKQSISDVKKQEEFYKSVTFGSGSPRRIQPQFEYKISGIGSIFIEFGFNKSNK